MTRAAEIDAEWEQGEKERKARPVMRLPYVSLGTSTLPIDRPGIGLEHHVAAVLLTAQPHETAGLYADDHAKVIPTFELVRLAELIDANPAEAARRVRTLIRD